MTETMLTHTQLLTHKIMVTAFVCSHNLVPYVFPFDLRFDSSCMAVACHMAEAKKQLLSPVLGETCHFRHFCHDISHVVVPF